MTGAPDIPLTVVGGFLGAGKTTLLNHVLRGSYTERIVVMVNDFGSINIDAELIDRRGGDRDDVISLSNGCVCCSIGGDLIEAFLRVLRLPERPDRILVEASGVADPRRIAQIGRASAGLRDEGVLVLADAAEIRTQANDRYVGDIVKTQLAAADLLVLNKVDLLDSGARASVRAWLAAQAPHAAIMDSEHARVHPELVLGPTMASAPSPSDGRPSAVADAVFRTVSLVTRRRFDKERLTQALDSMPAHVLRAKGVLYTTEAQPQPRVLQLTGRRWTLTSHSHSPQTPESRLVFIMVAEEEAVFDPEQHFSQALAD